MRWFIWSNKEKYEPYPIFNCWPFIDYYASRMLKQSNPYNPFGEIKMQKMTRQEAKEKIAKLGWMDASILDVIEALGLIEFESTPEQIIANVAVGVTGYSMLDQESVKRIMDTLMKNGYRFEKVKMA